MKQLLEGAKVWRVATIEGIGLLYLSDAHLELAIGTRKSAGCTPRRSAQRRRTCLEEARTLAVEVDLPILIDRIDAALKTLRQA